ncbi:uncharacterized protein LOC134263066 [Saccostrea cucullata]|uniref:uncharacterized protein LOC134263066 n=1 Tax=Saccostrea cuccullata TaxID=36930 RepID=UPI002ED084DD
MSIIRVIFIRKRLIFAILLNMNTGMEYKVIAFLLFLFNISDLYMTEASLTWNMAELKCKYQNKTLPSKVDINSYNFEAFEFSSVWSSLRGPFTPWITSKGCYRKSQQFVWPFIQHSIPINTVGNCYQLCQSKDMYEGGCKSRNIFYFGLMSEICICICNVVPFYFLTDSQNCNIPCLSSIENGYCGGSNFISVYKKDFAQRNLDISKFYGFCLVCMHNSSNIVYSGKDCREPTQGLCVDEYEVLSSMPFQRTMDDYWAYCKSKNLFITGSTEPSFCFRKNFIWTGLRKYRISDGSSNTEDECYSLEQTDDSDWVYKRRDCNENLPFVCKPSSFYNTSKTTASLLPNTETDFQNTDVGSASGNVNITTRSPMLNLRDKELKSGTIGAIVGSGVAIIILSLSLILLFLRFKKTSKLRTPSVKFTNKAYKERGNYIVETNDLKENSIYINEISKNCSQTTADHDDVYVENAGGEYDILHSSRQKKSSDDNPQYDSMIGWDNAYSSTSQQDNTNHGNRDESDYNTMDGTQDRSCSIENSDYDTCNRYVTSDGNLY